MITQMVTQIKNTALQAFKTKVLRFLLGQPMKHPRMSVVVRKRPRNPLLSITHEYKNVLMRPRRSTISHVF